MLRDANDLVPALATCLDLREAGFPSAPCTQFMWWELGNEWQLTPVRSYRKGLGAYNHPQVSAACAPTAEEAGAVLAHFFPRVKLRVLLELNPPSVRLQSTVPGVATSAIEAETEAEARSQLLLYLASESKVDLHSLKEVHVLGER